MTAFNCSCTYLNRSASFSFWDSISPSETFSRSIISLEWASWPPSILEDVGTISSSLSRSESLIDWRWLPLLYCCWSHMISPVRLTPGPIIKSSSMGVVTMFWWLSVSWGMYRHSPNTKVYIFSTLSVVLYGTWYSSLKIRATKECSAKSRIFMDPVASILPSGSY